MGPKIENVGFSLVLPLLFEGSKEPKGRPLVDLFEVLGVCKV